MLLSFNDVKRNFYDLSTFRVFYVISLLFESVVFTETLFGWISGIFIFWGFILSINIIFDDSSKLNINGKREALLFLFLSIVSSLVNFSSNFLMNIVTSFHNFMCMFLFLGMNRNTNKEKIESEMIFILKFFIFFSIFFSLVGIYFIFNVKHDFFADYKLGIYNNRFYGISTNPNQAGLISVISMFSCDLLNSFKKEINKIILLFCFIINLVVLFLTDSNASFVFLTAYLGIRMVYENFSKYNGIKEIKFVRETIFIFTFLIMIASMFLLARSSCQKFVSNIVLNSEKKAHKLVLDDNLQNTLSTNESVKIGRGKHELSSGRIQLFKQGIKLSKIHPLIGIGRENLSYYGKIYLDGGLLFPSKHQDLHNIYMTLIVSNGWIGLILFFIFVLSNLKVIILKIFSELHSQNSKFLSKLLSIIIAYFAYGAFEIGIMSGMFLSDILIWLFFGYALSYTL